MSFIYVVCQTGAEKVLKDEISRRHRQFRFAYSRPGFVTFKVPRELRRDRSFELKSVFARSWGFSIGKVSGEDGHALVREFWDVIKDRFPPDALARFTGLHVWERDRNVPGDFDFEPGVSPLADEIGEMILAEMPRDLDSLPVGGASELENEDDPHPQADSSDAVDCSEVGVAEPGALQFRLALNETTARNALVLDCVLVEPGEWWLGWHRATTTTQAWVGGVPEIDAPEQMVSRAYLKLAEALQWSGLPIKAGDRAVEIGSSPGGSCQCLLDRGLDVLGVDPAEMDEQLLKNPHFTHLRARAKDLKRRMYADCRWLMSDATVAPNYTLDTVEAIVTHPGIKIEGLLLTLKMPDWDLAGGIPDYHKRIRSWGYRAVHSRQLAFNRREICVSATGRDAGST